MGRRPCCAKVGLNRGAWSVMEDKILSDYVKLHGEGKWRDLPEKAGLKRCGKSCRLRWLNYLRPDIRRGNISSEEEDLIVRLHKLLGNRWALIAGRLPGRTDNEIKNYWNTNLRRKIQSLTDKAAPNDHDIEISKPVFRTKAFRCSKVVAIPRLLDQHAYASGSTTVTINGVNKNIESRTNSSQDLHHQDDIRDDCYADFFNDFDVDDDLFIMSDVGLFAEAAKSEGSSIKHVSEEDLVGFGDHESYDHQSKSEIDDQHGLIATVKSSTDYWSESDNYYCQPSYEGFDINELCSFLNAEVGEDNPWNNII